LGHHAHRLSNVARAHRITGAQRSVQLLEYLPGDPYLVRRTDQSHLVAPSARRDSEFLLQNAEGAVPFSVELGGGLVVVEDEGLSRGGVVLGQEGSLF